MKWYLVFCVLSCAIGSTVACQDPDSLGDDDADELAVGEVNQGHTTIRFERGILSNGVIKTGTLTNGAFFEYVERYKYNATAGQTVSFDLEIPTSTGGAWLGLTSGAAFPPSSYLKQVRDTTENRVHFDYTFTRTGIYYLYVRQGAHASGRYAYTLGADTGLCAMFNAVHSNWPGWTFYFVQNFLLSQRAQAMAYSSPFSDSPGFQVTERSLFDGFCGALEFNSCSPTDPPLAASDLQCQNFENICAMKNQIHANAGGRETVGSEYPVWTTYRFDGTCEDHPTW